jgi:hypothetical protein
MKSQKCIITGYGDNAKVYKLYNPSLEIVIISTNVIFHEEFQLKNIR